MTDPNSPDIQAIFAQLHTLGVTPEQAAAGVRAAVEDDACLYRLGDRVCIARTTREDGTPTTRDDWTHVVAPLLGQVGVVGKTDYTSGDRDNTEVRVDVTHPSYAYAWLAAVAASPSTRAPCGQAHRVEPRFMDCTLPPPDPSLQGVMDVAVQAQAAGIEWQGRTLVNVAADLEDKEPTT